MTSSTASSENTTRLPCSKKIFMTSAPTSISFVNCLIVSRVITSSLVPGSLTRNFIKSSRHPEFEDAASITAEVTWNASFPQSSSTRIISTAWS
ncbi:hypothetical protein BDW60DRAFT_187966 [Aspergillus nidulans var. acristatus]